MVKRPAIMQKSLPLQKNKAVPMSVEDAQIAAIALQNSALLATRNTTDFDFLNNLRLVNPWLYSTN
jgi:hypothetical protein